ncbi:MAG: AtpZ/AtpI family protein [Methylocystis sp.]
MMTEDEGRSLDQAALQARLDRLSAALRRADEEKYAVESQAPERKGFTRAMRVGLNAVSEFVGAILVSAFVGWQADKWLGTQPWLLVFLVGLGVAAGFYNVYRVARPKDPRGGAALDHDV